MDIKKLEEEFKKLPLIEKQKVFDDLKKEYNQQPTDENTQLIKVYMPILKEAVSLEREIKEIDNIKNDNDNKVDINNIEDFKKLPLLEKQAIFRNIKLIYEQDKNDKNMEKMKEYEIILFAEEYSNLLFLHKINFFTVQDIEIKCPQEYIVAKNIIIKELKLLSLNEFNDKLKIIKTKNAKYIEHLTVIINILKTLNRDELTVEKIKLLENSIKKEHFENKLLGASLICIVILVVVSVMFSLVDGNGGYTSESDKFEAQMNKSPSTWTNEEKNRYNGFTNWLEKQ